MEEQLAAVSDLAQHRRMQAHPTSDFCSTSSLEAQYGSGRCSYPHLRFVFCGTAAGRKSANVRAYYAGRGNLFWRTLHETGFARALIDPTNFRDVLAQGIGLTDLCKHVSGNDNELRSSSFDVEGLRRKIWCHRPAVLAFTSLNAGQKFCGRRATLGWQAPLGAIRIYVLPSTSLQAVGIGRGPSTIGICLRAPSKRAEKRLSLGL